MMTTSIQYSIFFMCREYWYLCNAVTELRDEYFVSAPLMQKIGSLWLRDRHQKHGVMRLFLIL